MSSEREVCEQSLWRKMVETKPLTASSQTRLAKVMSLMVAHPEASCILAVYRRKVVGIATRQDLMGVMVQTTDWPNIRLSKAVTRPVITVSPSDVEAIAPLLEQFKHHQISHLPVVDKQARLVGLVTQSRLLQALQHQGAGTSFRQQHQRSQLFAEITLKIRQSLQLKEILQTTVNEVQRLLEADRVLIYQVLPDGTGQPISEAVVAPYPAVLGMTFPEEVFPEEYQTL